MTNPMTEWDKARIEAAQKACDAATDGPWKWDRSSDDPFLLLAHAEIISEGDGEPGADDDLIFIEIARTELPAALKEIERSHAETKATQAALDLCMSALTEAKHNADVYQEENRLLKIRRGRPQ